MDWDSKFFNNKKTHQSLALLQKPFPAAREDLVSPAHLQYNYVDEQKEYGKMITLISSN